MKRRAWFMMTVTLVVFATTMFLWADNLIEVTEDNIREVLEDGLVLVALVSDSCKDCSKIVPIMDKLSKEMTQIKVAELNVDRFPHIKSQIENQKLPMLAVFYDGEQIDKFDDALDETSVRTRLLKIINDRETEMAVKSGKKKFTEAYDFTLNDLDGKPVTLSKIKGMVILDVWATWCPPCRKEIPFLQKLHDQYKDKGLTIVGVSSEDSEIVRKFRHEMKAKGTPMDYVLLVDPDRVLATKLNISGIPSTYFIAPNGKLIKQKTGFSDDMVEEFETLVKQNINKK